MVDSGEPVDFSLFFPSIIGFSAILRVFPWILEVKPEILRLSEHFPTVILDLCCYAYSRLERICENPDF